MTPVFCCGFECGVGTVGGLDPHFFNQTTAGSISTTTVRTGSRSIRINPSAAIGYFSLDLSAATSDMLVARVYVLFATLPNATCPLVVESARKNGAFFNASDSKIYAGERANGATINLGATGVSVTTGVWYRIDVKINQTADPNVVDVSVNGVSCGQLSYTRSQLASNSFELGSSAVAFTGDVFFDDFLLSYTSGDYPLGPGYVNHFVPTADGTHNVASTNDFERGTTGTDIINSTTDSYLLIDDIPMDNGTADTNDYINAIAPLNATDYVEHVFGPAPGVSTPSIGPRAVQVSVAHHQAGTGAGSSQFKLNDNGTEDTIVALSGAGVTTIRHATKHYATMVGGGAWTAARFNALRHRFGFVGDANPDQYFDCAMIEAEFEDRFGKAQVIQQAVKRANHW